MPAAGAGGKRLAQAALRQTLFAAEAVVLTVPALYLATAHTACDGAGRLTDDTARAALRRMLAALAAALAVGSRVRAI